MAAETQPSFLLDSTLPCSSRAFFLEQRIPPMFKIEPNRKAADWTKFPAAANFSVLSLGFCKFSPKSADFFAAAGNSAGSRGNLFVTNSGHSTYPAFSGYINSNRSNSSNKSPDHVDRHNFRTDLVMARSSFAMLPRRSSKAVVQDFDSSTMDRQGRPTHEPRLRSGGHIPCRYTRR